MAARRPLVAIGGQIQELPVADSVVGAISSPTVTSIVSLTQAAYDALSPPDPNTLYLIEGETGFYAAHVGTTPPADPAVNDLWVDTN